MSDQSETEKTKKEYSDSELAVFHNARHQRNKISESLKNGSLCCLPRSDGYADTTPAVNIESGKVYHGNNLLYLKAHQNQIGAPTANYITVNQIENAKLSIPGLGIREGQKGVELHFDEKNEETQQWENKNFRLVNISQVTKPEELKNWAEKKQQQHAKEREEYKRNKEGDFYKEPKQKSQGPDISCSSTEPEKYLAQYLAAVSMGSKFKVSPEQAKEFATAFNDSLFAKQENGYADTFKLQKICIKASEQCKSIIKETLNPDLVQKQQHEQKQEQSISF